MFCYRILALLIPGAPTKTRCESISAMKKFNPHLKYDTALQAICDNMPDCDVSKTYTITLSCYTKSANQFIYIYESLELRKKTRKAFLLGLSSEKVISNVIWSFYFDRFFVECRIYIYIYIYIYRYIYIY